MENIGKGIKRKIECGDCGEKLDSTMKVCPKCGSIKKKFIVEASDGIIMRDSLKAVTKNRNGKPRRKFILRNKLSGQGKEAKEQLDIDIAANRKRHHVDEKDENGNWKTVHHEDEPLKGG